VVGDSLKVCTWAAEGTGQVVSTSASVGARSHSGASSSARSNAESGTASSSSRRPHVVRTEDEPSEPTAASSSFVVDPYRFSGPQLLGWEFSTWSVSEEWVVIVLNRSSVSTTLSSSYIQ